MTPGYAQSVDPGEAPERPITLVGCVQREVDYREMHNIGKGGPLGLGGGRGDEFVLVNAFEITPGQAVPAGTDMSCGSSTAGDAYELEGGREEDLASHVGRRVEISGTRGKADIDVTTGRPTGGSGIGSDLQLFEVKIASVTEPMLAQAPAAAAAGAGMTAQTEYPPQTAPSEQPVGTSGVSAAEAPVTQEARAELPTTATPLPLAGLLGILSLAAAAGLRLTRRF
jgi:hypothetical protein